MRILAILMCGLLVFSCGEEKRNKRSKPNPIPIPSPTIPTPNPIPTPPEQLPPDVDDVYGRSIPSSTSWRVKNGNIYFKDNIKYLRGLNWFGFNTPDLIVHGLWTGRSMESFLVETKSLGFNALRIPIAPQVFDDNMKSNHHGKGKDRPIDNLNDLLTLAAVYDFSVVLDLHSCSYKSGLVGSPLACDGYGVADWHRTLRDMARLSQRHANVVGIDLFNEPYKLTWTEWKGFVSAAAKEILRINPGILIFVEGTANNGDNDGYTSCWGEYLTEAAGALPDVPMSRLVFSPHSYGPTVTDQAYHHTSDFPRNMNKIWDIHFGYLIDKGFAVSLGEFGGRYLDKKDKLWQEQFINYLKAKRVTNFFYWSLNPNSGDTGGIYADDWTTQLDYKIKLIQKLF